MTGGWDKHDVDVATLAFSRLAPSRTARWLESELDPRS